MATNKTNDSKPTRKKETKPRRTKKNPDQKTRAERCLSVIQLIETEGLSLIKACKNANIPRSEFHEEEKINTVLSDQYARAREKRAELYLDEVIEIADDETQDKTPFYGAVKVKRDSLRIETRLKYLATMYPKKYGNKLELSGDKENPLQVTVFQLPDNKRD